jgi:hypothetical protein
MPHGSGLIREKGQQAKRQLTSSYSARLVGRHDLARALGLDFGQIGQLDETEQIRSAG